MMFACFVMNVKALMAQRPHLLSMSLPSFSARETSPVKILVSGLWNPGATGKKNQPLVKV